MNCSENMAAYEKDRFIQYLVDKVNTYELDKRATELAVEEFQSTFDSVSASLESLKKEMEEIKAELREERSKRKKAEAKARKLDQQLKYARKNKFGDKRQNACKDEKKDDSADREDEKDKFDGTEGTVSTKSVQENPKEENPLKEKKERVNKFWNGIFAYQKDGNYPIDNNIAELTIRKLTTQRNNSLHYGSDEGVEMAVAYHSVISTVKLHGMSCWRYLGEFFKKIFNGCRDFFSLTPANIGMAYAKYRANEYKVKLACLYRVQPIFKN